MHPSASLGTRPWKSTPYWWEAAPVAPLPETPLPVRVDVLIVGAGYAGLSAGLALARAGRSVAVLDAMNPGEGASSRNGGITSGNIRPDHRTLVRRFGQAAADQVTVEGRDARAFLTDLIRSEGLECDFQPVGRFTGAFGYDQYDVMARDAEALSRRLGIETYAVPHAEQHGHIGTDHYRGGTVRMDIGGLHPGRFHAELLRVALAAGVAVHSGCRVKAVWREGAGFAVQTARGAIEAGRVLVCTNGYTDAGFAWLRRRIVPVRSRIIATDPLPAEVMQRLMPRRMMMAENSLLGFYYRPSPDFTRILLGGRDQSIQGEPEAPTHMLREGLVRLFPELAAVGISHSWFGNVAMHRDMLPRIFQKDGVDYATGFCGSGVVWAPWIGARAAARILNGDRAPASVFDFRPPKPVPLYTGWPYFMPAVTGWYFLRDRLALSRARR